MANIESTSSKASQWLAFVGALLLILGIYGAARTVVNFIAFEKYPTTGVLSLSEINPFGFSESEQDCTITPIYTDKDGNAREPTKVEIQNQEESKQSCLVRVAQARKKAQIDDVTRSVLFILLGLGAVKGRKFIFK